jgi:hypothetical protein
MSRSDGSTADYYVLPEGATQLQDLISHRNMNAQIGEITRACYRYGMASHSDMLRDAKKIRFYAQAEVERLEKLSAVVEDHSHIISEIPQNMHERINWMIGDVFEVTTGGYEFGVGAHVRLINDMTKEKSPCCEYLDGSDYWWVPAESLKFIKRPTSTTK